MQATGAAHDFSDSGGSYYCAAPINKMLREGCARPVSRLLPSFCREKKMKPVVRALIASLSIVLLLDVSTGWAQSRRSLRYRGNCTGCSQCCARQPNFVERVKMAYQPPPNYAVLGTISDSIWRKHERSAEAADFIFYEHEFKLNGTKLNDRGLDHVRQVAFRLLQGEDFPIVVEISLSSPRPDTQYEYPVHPNPELDMQRRAKIVKALDLLGVENAESRVVVAPAYSPGALATDAIGAYQRSATLGGLGGGFGGGGRGGFGGGVGGGGFGGGGFF